MPWLDLFKRNAAVQSSAGTPRRRLDLNNAHHSIPIYVIGDVHGRLDAVLEAEARIKEDISGTRTRPLIIYLGDYVDRGPESRRVLEHFLLPGDGIIRRLPLCGNHDDIMLQVLDGQQDLHSWIEVGGLETIHSYGIETPDQAGRGKSKVLEDLRHRVPASHIAFLRNLPVAAICGHYLFVHAGIIPGEPLEMQSDADLMWIREPFLSKGSCLPITVVHGHTISPQPVFERTRIGIDTGAYLSGTLSILKIEGNSLKIL